jgi:hypothetical protein
MEAVLYSEMSGELHRTTGSEKGSVAGSSGHGTEYSSSMNGGNFPDQLPNKEFIP